MLQGPHHEASVNQNSHVGSTWRHENDQAYVHTFLFKNVHDYGALLSWIRLHEGEDACGKDKGPDVGDIQGVGDEVYKVKQSAEEDHLTWNFIVLLEANDAHAVVQVAVPIELFHALLIESVVHDFVELLVNVLVVEVSFQGLLPELVLCLVLIHVFVNLPFLCALILGGRILRRRCGGLL